MNIRIICWNINMFNPPKIKLKNKIIDMINNKSDKVDFIFLIESSFEFTKELLSSKLGETFRLFQGFALSHGGFVNLLYRNNYQDNLEMIQTELPALIIKGSKTSKGITNDFYIAGCHLYPFAENIERRVSELIEINSIFPKDSYHIMIGDMNMREKEVTMIYKNKLLDKNKVVYYNKNKESTWYASFFDKAKIHIRARYDKLFYSNNIDIKKFELFGNKNNENKFELLSDHLGILTKIKFL